jgi:hypothetical protein
MSLIAAYHKDPILQPTMMRSNKNSYLRFPGGVCICASLALADAAMIMNPVVPFTEVVLHATWMVLMSVACHSTVSV